MIQPNDLLTLLLILATAVVLGRLLAPYITSIFTSAPNRIDRIVAPIENRI
ncbi:potassium-transporting ATPase subunit KdpA [Candidatus Bathyarchaeota archaeon]|nr:MAG: potassium-transporting ATPase subunit KdpA [Candidatus Bathyarchaeota archaeon]